MSEFNRIIFVCDTGTARAHMAAEIMRQKCEAMENMEILARGLVVLFPEPINEKAEAVMVSNGIDVSGLIAQPLLAEEINDTTLVITMNEQQKQKVTGQFDNAKKVLTLYEAVAENGEIIDPYGGPLTGYGRCYEQIEELIRHLVQIIKTGGNV